MPTFGRQPIYTGYETVDASNIIEVLGEVWPVFTRQRAEVRHLFDVYRGKQRVLERTKDVRPEINNKIVRNHANEIVSFKVSYLLSEPVKYVMRCEKDVSKQITRLNDFMFMESKDTKDKEIADHFNICGIAYRMVLPNEAFTAESDEEAPFHVYTLEPDNTFVIRSGGLGHEILCGVYVIRRRNEEQQIQEVSCVYTPTDYFEIITANGTILKHEPNPLGGVPIFEYINNEARLGAFETVETLLDSINTLESNRLDGTEQAVQSLLVFKNCEIDGDGYDQMRKKGAVNLKAAPGVDAGIEAIATNLNQGDQQILMDSMYNTILSIAGMPAASDNVSDSSNNGAVFMRSGWYAADARAKDSEKLWRRSETEFLRLALRICRDMNSGVDLKLADIGIKFTRRNYEDILSKSQTLVNLLSSGIHPQYAIEQSGLFYDPSEVYRASIESLKKWEYKDESDMDTTVEDEDGAGAEESSPTERKEAANA